MENKKTRKILVIEDSQTDLFLLQKHLSKMGFDVLLANNAQEGIYSAINERPDIILLDVMLPDIDGFEVCDKLKSNSKTSEIPVIFISSNDQACNKATGINAGAVDYITKPFDPSELKARIESVLRTIVLEEKILLLANTDELTGLNNRRRFFDILGREMLSARMNGKSMYMMMLDIDHFKNINDTYGHLTGDIILRQLGKILKENTYPLDVIGRYGGEEFTILMPDTSHSAAIKAAEKLRKIIDGYYWDIGEKCISVSISIGIASVDSYDSHELIKRADDALYKAKAQGRNCIVCWGDDKTVGTKKLYNGDYNELQLKVSTLAEQTRYQVLEVVSSFMKTIAAKDPYTANHAKNTQAYALAIADEMKVSQELREKIKIASLLHDIGKIGVPDWLLLKSGPLEDSDRQIIERHPITSVEILEPIGLFRQELPIIRHHHEKFDGTGYPDHLKGKEIPIGSRILAVADVFDAMTSDRPYRAAKPCEDALWEIVNYSGSQFDPEVVEAFQRAYKVNKEQWPLTHWDAAVDLTPEFVGLEA
ncbi:MAG TPA: diguanylate cyclase [Sedimentisphaerales bacterium]|nr:diguanylate cyclase [Sedimentisphaerales bacterium]